MTDCLTRAKNRRMICGQLLYDEPWHCSFCGFPYLRRHLLLLWDLIPRQRGEFLRRSTVRICAARPTTKDAHVQPGCAEMGFERLLRGVKQMRFSRSFAA